MVFDSIAGQRKRRMRVAAKNAVTIARAGIFQRTFGDLVRQAQPAGIHAIQKAREDLAVRIELLNAIEDLLPQPADEQIAADEAVKLVAMDGQMAFPGVLPHIALVNRHADQMRHQLGQAMIVIAFNPDHLHTPAWIGKLADVAEQLPVVAGQAAEIKIRKNITQQHKPAEAVALKDVQRIPGTAQLRAQMEVRQDESVASSLAHTALIAGADEPGMSLR